MVRPIVTTERTVLIRVVADLLCVERPYSHSEYEKKTAVAVGMAPVRINSFPELLLIPKARTKRNIRMT